MGRGDKLIIMVNDGDPDNNFNRDYRRLVTAKDTDIYGAAWEDAQLVLTCSHRDAAGGSKTPPTSLRTRGRSSRRVARPSRKRLSQISGASAATRPG